MQNFAPLTLPEMLKLSCHGQTIYARKRIFERFRNFESVRRLTKACRLTSAIPLKAAARWSDKNHSKPFSSSPKDATEKPSRATQSNKIREAVIVEGLSDKRAVQRSVPHAVGTDGCWIVPFPNWQSWTMYFKHRHDLWTAGGAFPNL